MESVRRVHFWVPPRRRYLALMWVATSDGIRLLPCDYCHGPNDCNRTLQQQPYGHVGAGVGFPRPAKETAK